MVRRKNHCFGRFDFILAFCTFEIYYTLTDFWTLGSWFSVWFYGLPSFGLNTGWYDYHWLCRSHFIFAICTFVSGHDITETWSVEPSFYVPCFGFLRFGSHIFWPGKINFVDFISFQHFIFSKSIVCLIAFEPFHWASLLAFVVCLAFIRTCFGAETNDRVDLKSIMRFVDFKSMTGLLTFDI